MTEITPSIHSPHIWPVGTSRDADGALTIGGVSATEIGTTYGTPVYIYDEGTLRTTAKRFIAAFNAAYPKVRVVYAGKAFLTSAIVGILREEGLGLDVVSGGELYVGLKAGMPPAEISLHGNNKSRRELQEAIEAGIGKIVIDNDDEITLLEELTAGLATPLTVLLRLNPGVDVHTHQKISTGLADSKFGLPIADGQAEAAVVRVAKIPGLRLAGYHAHIGSQLFDPHATVDAIDELVGFGALMKERHGQAMDYLSPGGGFGVAYEDHEVPLPIEDWAEIIGNAVTSACARHGLPLPTIAVEPGRSIVGPAGVALYEVGSRKVLPGIRTYVSVDGGMADNIRPTLYGARYVAEIANREPASDDAPATVTIAGKFCESGDLLIEGISLPPMEPGDLLAVPAAGAYCLAMASNYNLAQKPAVILVNAGSHRLIRRRETYEDLTRLDVM